MIKEVLVEIKDVKGNKLAIVKGEIIERNKTGLVYIDKNGNFEREEIMKISCVAENLIKEEKAPIRTATEELPIKKEQAEIALLKEAKTPLEMVEEIPEPAEEKEGE